MDYKKKQETTADVVILDGAVVCGDTVLGKGCSVWFNAVIRGDEAPIRIGEDTNIQDNSTLHVGHDHPLTIGKGVTIGHACIVHGCTIGDNTLIGMGAILLDGARVGKNCIIGAGSLVTGKTEIPDGWMAFGNPAKPVRRLREEEIEGNRQTGAHYKKQRELYR